MKTLFRIFCVVVGLCIATLSSAQVPREDADWGVPPTNQLAKWWELHGETPMSIPGAKVVLTAELKKMIDGPNSPIILDVLGGNAKTRTVIPGSVFMGSVAADHRIDVRFFKEALDKLSGNDATKPIVIYCLNAMCKMAYNATLHAVAAGYSNVYWYRGGWASWKDAGNQLNPAPQPYRW